MSALLPECMKRFSEEFDIVGKRMYDIHYVTISEMLLAVFCSEKELDLKLLRSLAAEHHWSSWQIACLIDIAISVQMPSYSLPAGGTGYGTEIVCNQRALAVLEGIFAQNRTTEPPEKEENPIGIAVLIGIVVILYALLALVPTSGSQRMYDDLHMMG